MHKVDSFVRETQRIDGLGIRSVLMHGVLEVLSRLALRPFTFFNGMTVPAGTLVAAPLSAIHTDSDGEIYSNPEEFDGFRFEKLRESSEYGMASRHQAGITSTTHIPFGHGRLAG
ncbi:hypothetical protein BC827DRAFT_1153714 [Russula dissimulans]|nr:hypothetical protein BC827DRAFT_1153714 [Russula dissimulans]